MLNRLVSMICAIPSLPSQILSGPNDPPAERVMYLPASSRLNSFGDRFR